jgi:hypothetical protein
MTLGDRCPDCILLYLTPSIALGAAVSSVRSIDEHVSHYAAGTAHGAQERPRSAGAQMGLSPGANPLALGYTAYRSFG